MISNRKNEGNIKSDAGREEAQSRIMCAFIRVREREFGSLFDLYWALSFLFILNLFFFSFEIIIY